MAKLNGFEGFIREKIEKEQWTHAKLSRYFEVQNPGERGYSIRTIERFCADNNIHRTSRISDGNLDNCVEEAISKVGPTYGRKTMTGLLAAQGVRVSQQRVGAALRRQHPQYHHARRTATARQVNPIPYKADYFGHKLHVDQNEKCVMFGVTHACAVDGCSGKIVEFITMPVKNDVEIYRYLFRSIVLQYGMWDTIRVDHGKEWILMLFGQEQLAHLRRNTARCPHLQTTSKQNHCVERIWVEINSRVNYPIKTCLVELQSQGDIDMDCDHTKFCVSWFTIRVSNVGTKLAVAAWNEHPIPGRRRGIPNQLMQENKQTVQIDPSMFLETEDALQQFREKGSSITEFSPFGKDPLEGNAEQQQQERELLFHRQYSDFGPFFYDVVNGDHTLFREGLLFFIDINIKSKLK